MGSSSTTNSSQTANSNSNFGTNTTGNASTSAWAPQAAALQTAFAQAPGALAQSQAASALQPQNYTANYDPALLSTLNAANAYGNNTSTANLFNNGNSAASSGTGGISGALSGLQSFNPSANNSPQAIEDAANSYVQGQNIPAQVQAAMQQGIQTANQVTLPGISQAAATGGNSDSSRVGIAQGLVQQGLAEQAAALNNSLTGQAYGQGLSLASNNANTNNQATLQALSDMGAIGTGGLNAGTTAASNAINGQNGLYGLAENAGQGLTQNAQNTLTNQLQQYQAATQAPYAALSPYMQLFGSQLYGSNSTNSGSTTGNSQTQSSGTGTSTTQNDPGALGIIGGLLGGVGGLASGLGDLGWSPFGK